ncbi:MAG: hypothetical protein PVI91_14170 [Gammaproteobacteria bacterium]|jgi:hypothetical protein
MPGQRDAAMYFSYEHLNFRYEPFPIGLAKPVMDPGTYQELVNHYPTIDHFEYIPKLGRKYSLSERFNPRGYHRLIRSQPIWREFHRWIKSDEFVAGVLDALRARNLDLGYDTGASSGRRAMQLVKDMLRGRTAARLARLRARFEFSMLPADGGHILPHTDAPSKIVTLIISMLDEGEWDAAFGGGTDVNRVKDSGHSFNWLNAQGRFEDMEVLDTFPFTPNQAVVFVKTFNSWHSVRPMQGAGSAAMRRTLTINIETRV